MEIPIEKIKTDRRVKIHITLAKCLYDALKNLCNSIIDEQGRKYKISWFIEDLIIYTFSDKSRSEAFLNTFYEEIEEDEQEEN